MEGLDQFVVWIDGYLWGPPMLIQLCEKPVPFMAIV